jgi:hypothetical protein
MKCPTCRAEIPSTAKFCGGCGATIPPASPPPKPYQPPASPPPKPYQLPPEPVAPPYTPQSSLPITSSYSPSHASGPPPVEKKYKALRLIATLYKILAFVAGAACLLFGLFIFVTGLAAGSKTTAIGAEPTAIFGGAVGGLLLLFYGAFLFIFLYGLGEWMTVFMDIEENTRKTNEMLASRPQAH